jgi:hypothetical protein
LEGNLLWGTTPLKRVLIRSFLLGGLALAPCSQS